MIKIYDLTRLAMKTVRIVLITCIICGLCPGNGSAQLSYKNSSIYNTNFILTIDHAYDTNFQGKPTGYYLLKYWKPDRIYSSETSQVHFIPEDNYYLHSDNKNVKLEMTKRELTNYSPENNPHMTGASLPDTSMGVISTKPLEKSMEDNYISYGKFEYYVPDTSRISGQQSDYSSKKTRPVIDKIPFDERNGWHIFVGVLNCAELVGRIALAIISSSNNQSVKHNVSKETSKSGGSDIHRQRSSNFSNTKPRK